MTHRPTPARAQCPRERSHIAGPATPGEKPSQPGAYPRYVSANAYAVTPAFGPLPPTYLAKSAGESGLSAVWHAASQVAHLLGTHSLRRGPTRRPHG